MVLNTRSKDLKFGVGITGAHVSIWLRLLKKAVEGEGFAVDASVIEANASRFQCVEGSEENWTEDPAYSG